MEIYNHMYSFDRCMNSIRILQRQKAANKLENCYCQGNEDFDCQTIKRNMQELCFDKNNDLDSNEIDVDEPVKKKSSSSNTISAKLHHYLLLFSILFSAIFKTIQTSFEAMIS